MAAGGPFGYSPFVVATSSSSPTKAAVGAIVVCNELSVSCQSKPDAAGGSGDVVAVIDGCVFEVNLLHVSVDRVDGHVGSVGECDGNIGAELVDVGSVDFGSKRPSNTS
jgi:hypothetical protein